MERPEGYLLDKITRGPLGLRPAVKCVLILRGAGVGRESDRRGLSWEIAMVVNTGARTYLLCDRFPR